MNDKYPDDNNTIDNIILFRENKEKYNAFKKLKKTFLHQIIGNNMYMQEKKINNNENQNNNLSPLCNKKANSTKNRNINNKKEKKMVLKNKNKTSNNFFKDNNDDDDDNFSDYLKSLLLNHHNNKNILKRKLLHKSNSFFDNGDRYKYHKLHVEKLEKYRKLGILKRINDESQKAVYSPRYGFIFKKINSGPKWSELTGRKEPKVVIDNRPFSNLSMIEINDGRKTILSSSSKKAEKTKTNFSMTNNLKKINVKNEKFIKKRIIIKDEPKKTPSNKNNNSFSYSKKKTIFKPISKNTINKKRKYLKKWRSVPDFNSYLSREQVDKIMSFNKVNPNDNLFPSYNFIESRVKMMVLYNRKSFYNKQFFFKGIDTSEYYDANKTFNNLKGNKCSALEFNKMTSRPSDNILPIFMKGIHSRITFDEQTEKSLEMNNYSNGKFLNLNDLLSNRSFNRYVNLSLLKSNYIKPENIMNNSELISLSKQMQELETSKDNIGKYLEGIKMNKFDKITLKSISVRHKKNNIKFN